MGRKSFNGVIVGLVFTLVCCAAGLAAQPATIHRLSCTIQARKTATNLLVKPIQIVPEAYLQCTRPTTITSVYLTLIRNGKVLSSPRKSLFIGGSRIHCGPGGNCGDGKLSSKGSWRFDSSSRYRSFFRVRLHGVTVTVVGPVQRAITGPNGPQPTGPQPGPGRGF